MNEIIIETQDLRKTFKIGGSKKAQMVEAVKGVTCVFMPGNLRLSGAKRRG